MTSRIARCSRQAVLMLCSLIAAIPETSVRRSISFSKTSRVPSPKWRTIFLAVLGPTPLISPEPRYFSKAAAVAGFNSKAAEALN